MDAILQIIDLLASTLSMIIIVWMIISMLFALNVVGRDNQFLWQVERSIAALLDPLLRPIRRILPSTGALDFSPMVLILLIHVVRIVLGSIAA